MNLDAELAKLTEIVGGVSVPFDSKSLTEESNGTLILRGILATCGVDRQNEQFDGPSLRREFERYFSRNPVVVDEHRLSRVIGRLISYDFTPRGEIEVEAEIPRPPEGELMSTYLRIKSGVLRAFSIGGKWKRLPSVNGVEKLVPLEILEASVAGIGVNADATFELVGEKAMGSLDDELEALAALDADALDREVTALRGLLP